MGLQVGVAGLGIPELIKARVQTRQICRARHTQAGVVKRGHDEKMLAKRELARTQGGAQRKEMAKGPRKEKTESLWLLLWRRVSKAKPRAKVSGSEARPFCTSAQKVCEPCSQQGPLGFSPVPTLPRRVVGWAAVTQEW